MERKAGPGLIRRTLSGIWRALDRIRQASLNLIFLAVVAFLVAGWLASRPALYRVEDPHYAFAGIAVDPIRNTFGHRSP